MKDEPDRGNSGTQTCKDCGNPFAPTSNEQEYCVECGHIHIGEMIEQTEMSKTLACPSCKRIVFDPPFPCPSCDSLRAELAKAYDQISKWNKEGLITLIEGQKAPIEIELAKAKEENARLREAFDNYSRHSVVCAEKWVNGILEKPCTCGLDDLKAQLSILQ